jgi:hypothetical protein
MEGSLNSLVYDYLTNLGWKMADKFKKEYKPKALPPGSPGLKEIVSAHNSTPKKGAVQASPALKKKKVGLYSLFLHVRDTCAPFSTVLVVFRIRDVYPGS